MHEMSLCSGLREIIEEQSRLQHFSRVLRVRLEISALAGVESAALRFGFAVIMYHTLVQGAALKIICLPGQAWCPDCAQPVRIQRRCAPCPRCGGYALQVKGEMSCASRIGGRIICAVCSCAEQHRHPSGLHQARLVRLEQDLLAKNHRYADVNRRYLAEQGLFALNLVSSPGSGAVSSGGQPGTVPGWIRKPRPGK